MYIQGGKSLGKPTIKSNVPSTLVLEPLRRRKSYATDLSVKKQRPFKEQLLEVETPRLDLLFIVRLHLCHSNTNIPPYFTACFLLSILLFLTEQDWIFQLVLQHPPAYLSVFFLILSTPFSCRPFFQFSCLCFASVISY